MDKVEHYLHVEEVMQTRLFADEWNEKVDEAFVAEHGNAGLDESARVVHWMLVLYLSQDKRGYLGVSVKILPLLRSS